MNAGYGDAIARVSAEIAASVAAHRNVRAGLLDGPGDVVKGKEPRNGPTNTNTWGTAMAEHIHENHSHRHGPNCGHTAIVHDGHTDYLHDGHLHHPNGSGVEEHRIGVSGANAAGCTPAHSCAGHDASHRHGPGCGHDAVPHGDHVDYLVSGHLHHPHSGHCDDHGPVMRA